MIMIINEPIVCLPWGVLAIPTLYGPVMSGVQQSDDEIEKESVYNIVAQNYGA